MATITSTAGIAFSKTTTGPTVSASSSIAEGSEGEEFIRMIGAADTEDNQLALSVGVYPKLTFPSWLWVKCIDLNNPISVRLVNTDQITSESVEVARLAPGESTVLKIGRHRAANGTFTPYPDDTGIPADYQIVGDGTTLYDMVVTNL